ncbi:unnamed protein product [Peronospora belbahrii]|uniref:HMG box domain-containing protein n=1 Tax=Peronospora belbahrii TaxID=622444 RepID=A0AAU9LPB6_9STRA|nr:unnamed protein product [Peronospora belbahrii]
MQRYAVSDDQTTRQLGWSRDQLRAYLSPEPRRIRTASDIADTAVDKLLMRYRVALAHQTLKSAVMKPLKPFDGSLRRSAAPLQFGRNAVDGRRSIIYADAATSMQQKVATGVEQTGNRKRKRRVIVLPLDASATKVETVVSNDSSRKTKVNLGSTASQLVVRKTRHVFAKTELICPIRLDVDLDGIRFQDTFLVNSALTTCSPEILACHIAQDEQMSEKHRDAIAESIRRQMFMYNSCLSTKLKNGRICPIYVDLIIDGFSLRDQFEWDISNDCHAAQTFASTLCADLNLPKAFEPAIVFSIVEQVMAYRIALNGHKWIGANPFQAKGTDVTLSTSSAGYIETMPPVDDIVRDTNDANLWQPILSELSSEERTYLSSQLAAARAPTTWKSMPVLLRTNGRSNRSVRPVLKENRLPRPVNPFIVYCQMQKEALGKTRRSASEARKIMGDMWRKCTEEEKEYYAQVTEVENEKRRRDHILDMRDRAIADWEEDEARRKGLLASTTLEASTDHIRGLLLENYMSERHEVDMNRQEESAADPTEENEEEDEEDENEHEMA